MITILFLAANPADTPRLALDHEVKEIITRLRKAPLGQQFRVEMEWAVRADEIQAALLRHKPRIVHFSGHGQNNATRSNSREFDSSPPSTAISRIMVENHARSATPIPDEALSEMFRIVGGVECVVLNACHSAEQAEAILRHVNVVVGMDNAINDTAAIQFAASFYEALAFGRSMQTAFDLGKNQIALQNLPHANVPILSTRTGIDPTKLVLVADAAASMDAAQGKRNPLPADVTQGAAKKVLFSWIHLSDFHIGPGDTSYGYDQKLVLDQLRQDLPKARNAGAPAAEAILVTGDIALSGAGQTAGEYTEAKQWIEALAASVNLKAKHVFLVPGNHDINRVHDRLRAVRSLLGDLRSGDDSTEASLDNALKNEDDKALLVKRMQGFLEFAANFAPWCHHDPLPPADERLFWRHTISAGGGLRVRLVGLNTALVCADNSDEGKLQLGMEQLHFALKEAPEKGELVVVLTHHPLRPWLSDGKSAEQWLQNRAHVHLFGHVHEADLDSVRQGAGKSLIRMIAGAAHADKDSRDAPARYGYNIAAIEQDANGALELRIWPRRWSDKTKEFRADMDLLEDGRTSIAHALPIVLEAPAKDEFATPQPPDVMPAMYGTLTMGTVGTQWLTGKLMPIWCGKKTDSRIHFDLKDTTGKTPELVLGESRVYHLGRETLRTDGKTKNDCVLRSSKVSQDAASVECADGRWIIRNTSNKPRLRVNMRVIGADESHALVHRNQLVIGDVPGEFRDGRFHALAPMTAVDPQTGLMSREGLTCEVGLALAISKGRTLLAFFFEADDVQSACAAALALHAADPAVPIGRIDATIGMLVDDKSSLASRLETVQQLGLSPLVTGFLELAGPSTEAGARVEAVLGALARMAAAGGKPGIVDLANYALQEGSVEELADFAVEARRVGGGMGLLLLDEFDRYGELGESSQAAVELELREYLGALLKPSDRIASVDRGVIAVTTRQPVDRLLRDIATGWRARGAITVGKLELERTLRIAALDETTAKQLTTQPKVVLRDMGTGTNAHGLPTPIAYWLDAAQRAVSMGERAAGLVRTLEATWRILGCTLVTAFWGTRKGQPLPVAGATAPSWPAWSAVTMAVADALRSEQSRIGELADAVWRAAQPNTGALRLATEQASSLSSQLQSPALARPTQSLEFSLHDVFTALRTLRGWSLVAVRATRPADLAGEILRVECVDFDGPHIMGMPRRHTVAGMHVLPFVYLVRWAEGVAIPLEPLVRYTRVPGTNVEGLVFLDNVPSRPGFYGYAPVNMEGQIHLEVTERQLAR